MGIKKPQRLLAGAYGDRGAGTISHVRIIILVLCDVNALQAAELK
jgi:hypothetical protein